MATDSTRPTSTNPTPTSQPSTTPTSEPGPSPAFGWTAYAEQINGRFAMIGFVALLILEFFTGQDFFTWLGWR
jgi:hypothetical protein